MDGVSLKGVEDDAAILQCLIDALCCSAISAVNWSPLRLWTSEKQYGRVI